MKLMISANVLMKTCSLFNSYKYVGKLIMFLLLVYMKLLDKKAANINIVIYYLDIT